MHDSPAPAALRRTEWSSVTLPAALDQVGPAVNDLFDWLQARGVTEGEALEGVKLAASEGLTNAIRHGGPHTGPDACVRLAWAWRDGELELEISEPGTFSPNADWGNLPDDPLAEGGRGGFLISQLMDAVEHRNSGGRHALRLRKKLPHTSPAFAAQVLAENEATLNAMTEELGNAYETIAALFQFAESLATEPGLHALAEKSFARLRPLTGADAAWVRLAEADGTLAPLAGKSPRLPADSTTCEAEVARAGVERTLQSRVSLPPGDPLHSTEGCAFVCPFSFEGRLRGVLTVVRDRDSAGFFTAGQTGLVRTLADFLGIACANADLQEQRQQRLRAARELEIAAQIQRSLLPQSIATHPAWATQGVCSQAAEVGGDFFDVFDLPDGSRLVMIADVMGKGVPAALMATTLRTALRAHAVAVPDPAALLTQVNRQLCPDLQRLEMFITAQVVRLDPQGGGITYASAAHCPILVLDATGRAAWLEANGLPLGVEENERYEGGRTTASPLDRVLLMTDGALEQEDAGGNEIGADGFAALAAEAWRGSPDAAVTLVLRALRQQAGGHAAGDDCTLVAIARTTGGFLP
ncbi:MAG: SpoIIE family protein phosphatase [Burkholderiales bacterium]|nr:SpoIIE family protein phosphatase [Opitutaceae bacterium]